MRKTKTRTDGPAISQKCTDCARWKELKDHTKVAQVLREVIQNNGSKLAGADVSLAEFLKLVQLEKEFDQEPAKEIDVTWTDPSEESEK